MKPRFAVGKIALVLVSTLVLVSGCCPGMALSLLGALGLAVFSGGSAPQ
ncbi:MAG: hypothetical protein GXY33_08620 [Phycisphaerae bacterium]|nr:hypothetical protein [Phycisphaerae bacterium]